MTNTKQALQRITILGTLGLVMILVLFFNQGYFNDPYELQHLLRQTGVFAPVLFILIQIVQVIVPIIPGGISCALGVLAFGGWEGFLYNYIGLVIGSILAFILVKKYGRPFILKVTNEKTFHKYIGWLDRGKKFEIFFAIAMFLPGFPDDLLCMIAGLTKMSVQKFVVIILISKPAALLGYSYGLVELGKLLEQIF